jgi:hypothetical protein
VRSKNVGFHPWRPLALGAALALSLILLLTVISYAGRHATWQATEFQVLNLEDVPADLTARFYDPTGMEVYSRTYHLLPGHTEYYKPEQGDLDPAFVGALHVETEQEIAGAVMHVATTTVPGFGGDDVFSMYSDDITDTHYLVPYVQRPSLDGDSARICLLITNLGPEDVQVTIEFYDQTGTGPLEVFETIPAFGSITHLPNYLNETFVGSAIVLADQPIWVDIVEFNDTQWAVYAAPPRGSTLLYAPLVPAYRPGLVTPTIGIQSVAPAQVAICRTDDQSCQDVNLEMSNRIEVTSNVASPYIITSTGPIAAKVSVEGAGGHLAYTAGGEEQIGNHLAAPMLFDGYHGFTTTLWVYNTGEVTAAVTVTYIGTEGEARLDMSASIGPDQVQGFGPALGQPHYAALVKADQPILGLVEGSSTTREDGRFAYWATPFVPPTRLVYLPLVIR